MNTEERFGQSFKAKGVLESVRKLAALRRKTGRPTLHVTVHKTTTAEQLANLAAEFGDTATFERKKS